MRKIFLIITLLFAVLVGRASNDSVWLAVDTLPTTRTSFYIVPTVEYSQESSWAFGLTGANYFGFTDYRRISSLTYSANYSLNHQYSVSVYPKLYFGDFYLYGKILYQRHTDYYAGIGNAECDVRVPYISNLFLGIVQPQYYLTQHFSLGVQLNFRYEQLNGVTSQDKPLLCDSEINGVLPYYMGGLGILASYDSRDNLFYPTTGLFFKSILSYSEVKGKGIRTSYGQLIADFRQYVPIYDEFVFAWQFNLDAVLGSNIPFQLLPTFGGCDLMRGFRSGIWRDDLSMALQAEFRIPIWWRFKFAVFGGLADVYNFHNWQFTMPKASYGAGLRLRFNRAKVNLRFDVARTNYGDWRNPRANWQYYFTASEAF